ncbi:MAG: Plug domain-containing protein [Gammaproteobacteria bacterium]|nr:Plug domain-containing protein [Gammaproteobacteria bacterium]
MTFSTTKRIVAHIICVSTVLYFTGVALAQVEQETDEDATMEVIYVTAEKREENILDVPLSITAFNDDLIEELGITNDFDVEQLVPGLQFGDDTEKVGQGTVIRGIGSRLWGETHSDLAVATYVDGVYTHTNTGV